MYCNHCWIILCTHFVHFEHDEFLFRLSLIVINQFNDCNNFRNFYEFNLSIQRLKRFLIFYLEISYSLYKFHKVCMEAIEIKELCCKDYTYFGPKYPLVNSMCHSNLVVVCLMLPKAVIPVPVV